jgi:hypothetical protein
MAYIEQHRQEIGATQVFAEFVFPCHLLAGAWHGKDEALFFVRRLLADLMPPAPLNRAFCNNFVAVMQQHFFFPCKCTCYCIGAHVQP